jgi:hypothetical protein
MDLSALEGAISKLERSLNSLGGWLVFFTLLVVIGLILEYAEDLKDLITKRPFKWKLLGAMVGALLITAGVAGELVVEYRASRVETELRTANEKVIAMLNQKAGDAQVSADKAANSADRANSSAKKANDEAGTAEKRAEEIGRQADELRGKTSDLANGLAESQNTELAERKKVLDLESSLAPRILGFQIGPGNKTSFDELTPFAGTQVMFEVLTDAEARRAAQEIGNVLHFAGWNVTGTVSNSELHIGFFDGVSIWYEQPEFLPGFSAEQRARWEAGERCAKAAEALAAYLLSKNWKSMARAYRGAPGIRIPNIEHEIPPNTLVIAVGFKPNPFFDPDWVEQMEEQYKQFMIEERDREKNLPPIVLPH